MLLNFCAALLSWIFPLHSPLAKAPTHLVFLWWQQRQSDRLHRRAEQIREGIVQDLFAVRRTLELARVDHQPIPQT
ncbi:MAG: hypothetical protein F6K16_29450, partial [Symploca sp. SIO2B6]|nr:hypothetical protein [Symploca sp. SIO2B6]